MDARDRAQRLAHDERRLLRDLRLRRAASRRRRSGRSRRASPPRRRSSAGSRRAGSCRPRPSASARGTGPTCARRTASSAAVHLQQAPPQRHVAGRDQQQAEGGARRRGRRGRPPGSRPRSSPAGPGGRPRARPGRSMPMPNALVATITSAVAVEERALRRLAQLAAPARRGRRAARQPRPRQALLLLLGAAPRGRVDDGDARRRARARPAPRPAARPPARCRSRASSTSSARRRRLGRAKPRTCCGVSAGRPRRARISSRTTGVAVAVQASTRACGSSVSSAPISRYSGRKSWPHSLMQCASSMATSGTSHVLQQAAEAGEREPLRRGVDERVARPPRCAPCAAGPRSRPASRRGTWRSTPRASSAWTWSFISATSGEITSVVPGSSTAGSW